MKELQTLKYLIENPNWVKYTHDDIFPVEVIRIKKILNAFNEQSKPISFQALGYLLREKPDTLQLLEHIRSQESVDEALFLILRNELREEAKLRILNHIAQVPIDGPKAYKQALIDLQALESEDRPLVLNKPVHFKDWAKHIQPELTYVPSGLEPFADTGSDFKRGDLINILAASGNFKTGLMTSIARNQLLQGRNVLFYSMEESSQSLLARIGMGILELTPHQYSLLSKEELQQRFEAFEIKNRLTLGHLDVISGEIIYIEDMKQQIEDLEIERGYKYDYIVPDYSAMITTKNISKTAREDQVISKIFRELKLIAMDATAPKVILTAIQSNREGYGKKKTPDVENTSGSMGGVHVADLLISLKYRVNPEAPIRPTMESEHALDAKGFVKMTVRKKRTGTIKEGDSFIFTHLACGQIRFNDRMTTSMDNFELWDNLFATED